jgi:hypothetical protein
MITWNPLRRLSANPLSPVPQPALPPTIRRADAVVWQQRTGLTRQQADDLLDWLEAHGVRMKSFVFVPNEGFAVSYCCGANHLP